MAEFEVGERDAGRRLIGAALDQWPLTPEETLRRLIREGSVRVNGEPRSHRDALRKGDVVSVEDLNAAASEGEALDVEALYDDEHVVAVNKPFGCAVVRERWEKGCPFMEGVIRWLRENRGDGRIRIGFRPRPAHRLDRDTTGVTLVALSPEGERSLCEQFRERLLEKEYLALALGAPRSETWEVDAAIEEDLRDRKRMRIAGKRRGKPSLTRFEVAERFRGYTLLRCLPKSGRRHQVRLHLAQSGSPVAGDALYGGGEGLRLSSFKRGFRRKADGREAPLMGRVALHAFAITFTLVSGAVQRVEAPLPQDFERTLRALRKWAADG